MRYLAAWVLALGLLTGCGEDDDPVGEPASSNETTATSNSTAASNGGDGSTTATSNGATGSSNGVSTSNSAGTSNGSTATSNSTLSNPESGPGFTVKVCRIVVNEGQPQVEFEWVYNYDDNGVTIQRSEEQGCYRVEMRNGVVLSSTKHFDTCDGEQLHKYEYEWNTVGEGDWFNVIGGGDVGLFVPWVPYQGDLKQALSYFEDMEPVSIEPFQLDAATRPDPEHEEQFCTPGQPCDIELCP